MALRLDGDQQQRPAPRPSAQAAPTPPAPRPVAPPAPQTRPADRTGLARLLWGTSSGKERQAATDAARAAAAPPKPSEAEVRKSLGSGARVGAGGAAAVQKATAAPPPVAPTGMLGTPKRRQLTDEEWARLTDAQKNQVRFNNQLVAAYDLDQTESPKEHRNTRALISQLGLDERTRSEIEKSLGTGIGPAVTYADLFGTPANPESGVRAKDVTTANNFTPPSVGVVADPQSDRQKQVNQIAARLSEFLARPDTAAAQQQLNAATAAKDKYTFATPQAKSDYEEAFDYLRDRNNLANLSWSDALAGLQEGGYDPADFQRYVRERIQLYPVVQGQTSLQELDSWFGQ